MKKIIILLLAFVFTVLLLTACGGQKHEPTVVVETPAPVTETEEPAPTEEVQTEPEVPNETPQPEGTGLDNEKYQIALGLIGKTVEELYEAIGYPEAQDYGPSCNGDPGDKDGQLDYEGFSVFTIIKVKSGEEIIVDVFRDDEF